MELRKLTISSDCWKSINYQRNELNWIVAINGGPHFKLIYYDQSITGQSPNLFSPFAKGVHLTIVNSVEWRRNVWVVETNSSWKWNDWPEDSDVEYRLEEEGATVFFLFLRGTWVLIKTYEREAGRLRRRFRFRFGLGLGPLLLRPSNGWLWHLRQVLYGRLEGEFIPRVKFYLFGRVG